MTSAARQIEQPHAAHDLVSFFQPIINVKRGRVAGFEALARRPFGTGASAPLDILAALDTDGLFALFCRSLKQGIRLCEDLGPAHAELFISINVEASIIMRGDFAEVLRFILSASDFEPSRVNLEILEGMAIADAAAMVAAIQELKAIGVSIALDDVGSAYASLTNIKDLPVDALKLDQTFARGLADRPYDLQFVWSLVGLARGLNKRLVVEGVETMEIYDALSILDVEFIQGYAIARPMPAAAVPGWIEGFGVPMPDRTPRTLLGAYASHLMVVEACRVLACQPLPVQWKDEAKDPHACAIGRFFDQRGWHDGACGLAHKRFHRVLAAYRTDRDAWERAADEFRDALAIAIAGGENDAAGTRVPKVV